MCDQEITAIGKIKPYEAAHKHKLRNQKPKNVEPGRESEQNRNGMALVAGPPGQNQAENRTSG
jgi:hypothetical protein